MPKTVSYLKLLILICLCALFAPIAALAQTPTPTAPKSGIHINDIGDPVEVDGPGGIKELSLEVIFTLLDANKNVILNAKPENGSIVIVNGSFPAVVQQMEQPSWTVVVLIDASKTLGTFQAGGTLKAIKAAITSSLVPGGNQNMKISVVKFDQFPTTVSKGFTSTPEDYQKAINDIKAATSGTSCLNNAAYDAVTQLSTLPGRRAVVVVTASQDNCGQRTPQDVVQLADQNHVQIYAVGVKEYPITQKDLDDLTTGTGGIGILSPESTLGFAVSNIAGILPNQYSAKATLCPPEQGSLPGTLDIALSDGSQMTSDVFSFVSPQPYTCPPEIHIKGVVRPKTYGLDFNLDISSPDLINGLEVRIVDKATGLDVVNQTLSKDQFGSQNQFEVGNLKEGGGYTLLLSALSSTGVPLAQDTQDFTWVPEKVDIAVKVPKTPTVDEPFWTVEVDPAQPEGVVKFQVFLANDQDVNTPVSATQTVAVNEKITVPAEDKLPAGKYQIVVQALDGSDNVVARAASPVVWTPFTLGQKLSAWFSKNQWAYALVAVVCCVSVLGLAGVVWVVVPKPSSQPKQVDIMVPEKRQRAAPMPDSGYFEPPPPVAPPPPPPRAEPVSQRMAAPPPPPPQPAANLPRAFLSGYSPASVMPQVQITRVPLTIGRRVGNDVVLNVDNSMGVSGQHAKITFSNGRFFVLDEGSTYGTTLNGQTIPKGMPTPLEDGAVVGIGPKVKIQFRLDRGG